MDRSSLVAKGFAVLGYRGFVEGKGISGYQEARSAAQRHCRRHFVFYILVYNSKNCVCASYGPANYGPATLSMSTMSTYSNILDMDSGLLINAVQGNKSVSHPTATTHRSLWIP
jgi:hypothetical protein